MVQASICHLLAVYNDKVWELRGLCLNRFFVSRIKIFKKKRPSNNTNLN